ncbi:MAG: hypothetical protein KGZ68_16260 [Dechloromonas sp.]|uniref:urease accessory protein n=1 Tax=Dechloromonas sp. CZR5 TaxID=2608630 RepID=UPI00123DE682|nr:urease accessory protein [Dechloromonas sp. CZR5]MBS4019777.1 hypothetical protein [Dechloromonas sp.]
MTAEAILVLGLLAGAQHALDADHLAAVAALVARECNLGRALRHGVAWGIGHAATLLAFGGAVLLLGAAISEATAHSLEALVGVILVVLGVDLLRRLVRERVYSHAHLHVCGARHHHAHSDAGESGPHESARHEHAGGHFPLRAVGVGMVHGLAGSAALVMIALEGVGPPKWGFAYILVFGVGSILGMGLLSVAISLPLRLSAGRLSRLRRCTQGIVALATIGYGGIIITENMDPMIIGTFFKEIGV